MSCGTLYSENLLSEEIKKNVTSYAFGRSHALALTKNGEVFSWGSNGRGYEKVEAEFSGTVVELCCGFWYSLARTSNGSVYYWGYIYDGVSSSTPTLLAAIPGVTKICGGNCHVMLLTSEGCAITLGSNRYGQRGCGDMDSRETSPTKVIPPNTLMYQMAQNQNSTKVPKVVDIAAYGDSCVILSDGNLFLFGAQSWPQKNEPKPILKCKCEKKDFQTVANEILRNPTYQPPNQPTSDSTSERDSFTKSIADSLNDEDTSDVRFIINDKELLAHSSILKIRSPYFRELLKTEYKYEEIEIEIEDTTYDAFNSFLRYIYGCGVGDVALLDLYELAHRYSDKELQKKCQEAIKERMTNDVCLQLYLAACEQGRKELENFLLDYIAPRMMTEFIETETYRDMDAPTLKNLLSKLAKLKYQWRNEYSRADYSRTEYLGMISKFP